MKVLPDHSKDDDINDIYTYTAAYYNNDNNKQSNQIIIIEIKMKIGRWRWTMDDGNWRWRWSKLALFWQKSKSKRLQWLNEFDSVNSWDSRTSPFSPNQAPPIGHKKEDTMDLQSSTVVGRLLLQVMMQIKCLEISLDGWMDGFRLEPFSKIMMKVASKPPNQIRK